MGRYCVESDALTDAKRKINIRRAGATRHERSSYSQHSKDTAEDFMNKAAMMLGMLLLFAAAALAQMEMPKPAPELKKLDMFAGTWKLDGDIKPGPMGPGGKMNGQENCAWMDGGFYLVCNSTFKGPLGNATGTSYLGTRTMTRRTPIASSTARSPRQLPMTSSLICRRTGTLGRR
jgi:hypothetical protein